MATSTSTAPRHQVYWLDDVGPAPDFSGDLPVSVDVVVVGSGYTGLNAAIQTARGGRSTLVLDADDPGYGCSTRNGGQISTSIKPSLEKLAAKHRKQKARAIRGEGASALSWIEDFVKTESIDCDFRKVGRFHAAHSPDSYETLARDAETLRAQEGIECFTVPRAEQKTELGTDTYYGGLVYPNHCSLHPAKYHRGLLRLATDAGAQILGHCRVTGIDRNVKGFRVTTGKGTVEAREVVVATNGYTTGLTPWLQRRVIPIGSYIIATEELPKSLVNELFPTDRIASDTFKVLYYYRASPDRKRILFGGRVSAAETDPNISGPRLFESMCRIFPQLRDRKISHSWMGTVAYSFDELAHAGTHDGIHYAMGYCGSGVSMASYLGMRTGQRILGLAEGATAFDDLPFPTRPLYTGKPWFLPAAVAWYRWQDTRQYRRAAHA
jgi:glycine/D-amino acid oxidase-like deaminating enzyme